MKEELMKLGFVEIPNNFMELDKGKFSVLFWVRPDGDWYFYIETEFSDGGTNYPYLGIEKLKALIRAHDEFFK